MDKRNYFQKYLGRKKAASLPEKEGVDSELMKEGISELEEALFHINQNRLGAAATLKEGA